MVKLAAWAAVCTGAAFAQAPVLRIPRVAEPPRLADYLGNAGREPGVRVTGFRQHEPGDGTPVSQDTTAWLAYDHQNLYVAFVCREEPGQVRARLSKREDMEQDDVVELVLDTLHDHHRGYVFSANPHGIQREGIYPQTTSYLTRIAPSDTATSAG